MRARPSSRRRRSRRAPSGAQAAQLRQLGGGHAHAEQAHGQQGEDLGRGQGGHGAGHQVAGQQQVDVGRELHHAPAGHHRPEPAHGLPHAGQVGAQREPEVGGQPAHGGQLHGELRQATGEGAPGQRRGQPGPVRHPQPGGHQGADLGDVPHHGRHVGEEEASVAVEHAEAPGREHQHAHPREQDAGEAHGQVEALAGVAGGDDGGDGLGRHHAHHHDHAGHQGQQAGHGAGHPARLLLVLVEEPGRTRG